MIIKGLKLLIKMEDENKCDPTKGRGIFEEACHQTCSLRDHSVIAISSLKLSDSLHFRSLTKQ